MGRDLHRQCRRRTQEHQHAVPAKKRIVPAHLWRPSYIGGVNALNESLQIRAMGEDTRVWYAMGHLWQPRERGPFSLKNGYPRMRFPDSGHLRPLAGRGDLPVRAPYIYFEISRNCSTTETASTPASGWRQ